MGFHLRIQGLDHSMLGNERYTFPKASFMIIGETPESLLLRSGTKLRNSEYHYYITVLDY